MKILKKYEELVGKTIAYSHMAQFAQQITLATTDGDILMATFEVDDDGESMQIRVLWEHRVIEVIKDSEHMQKSLAKLGIWDLEAYRAEREEKQRLEKERYLKNTRSRELKQLRDLLEKYPEALAVGGLTDGL